MCSQLDGINRNRWSTSAEWAYISTLQALPKISSLSPCNRQRRIFDIGVRFFWE